MKERLSNDSILFTIPDNIDKKLIFCLDGVRITLQNIDLSYLRIINMLNKLSQEREQEQKDDYTSVKADAWAYVDNVYRFIGLWGVVNQLIDLELNYKAEFENIIKIRNVQSHLSQRIDNIVSNNFSVSGELSCIKLIELEPLLVKTFFIRSGLFYKKLNFQFNLPKIDGIEFNEYKFGSVIFSVSNYNIDIIRINNIIYKMVSYLEEKLLDIFNGQDKSDFCPSNIFGLAEIDTSTWEHKK